MIVVWVELTAPASVVFAPGPDSAVVRGGRGQVGDRGDAVVPARVVAVEGRRRAARRRARLRRPRDRVLVPGREVRGRRRDHRSGVVDADRRAVGELAVDVPRVLVPAAGSPRAAGVAAVAADVGLDASAHAGQSAGCPRCSKCRRCRRRSRSTAPSWKFGLRQRFPATYIRKRPVHVVVQRLVAGAARVPGIEVVPHRVVQGLRQARRHRDRRLQGLRPGWRSTCFGFASCPSKSRTRALASGSACRSSPPSRRRSWRAARSRWTSC